MVAPGRGGTIVQLCLRVERNMKDARKSSLAWFERHWSTKSDRNGSGVRDNGCVGLECGSETTTNRKRPQQTERDPPGDLENGNGILNPNELWPGPRLFCKLEKERCVCWGKALLIFLRHKSPVSVSALKWGWQTMAQRPNLDPLPGIVQLTKDCLFPTCWK